MQCTNVDSLQPFIQLFKAQVESSWTSVMFHLGVKSLHMRRNWKVLRKPVKNSEIVLLVKFLRCVTLNDFLVKLFILCSRNFRDFVTPPPPSA